MESKEEKIHALEERIQREGFAVSDSDTTKPWGAYFCIAPDSTGLFVAQYFPHQEPLLAQGLPISPKYLLIAPHARLSWQFHRRRMEYWRTLEGPVGSIRSTTDEEKDPQYHQPNTLITIPQEGRHRLLSGDGWGLVAEIWVHTDPTQPSDESDIVRLQDDYQR